MSWELSGSNDDSSWTCDDAPRAPLRLDSSPLVEEESIASKLQALALKASPQVQIEINEVLSSLSGEI